MLNAKVPLLSVSVLIALLYISKTDHILAKKKYYILQWQYYNGRYSFLNLGPGQKKFTRLNCKYKNCYVTRNKTLFQDMKKFDAIIFHLQDLFDVKDRIRNVLPSGKNRSKSQKYIFASLESEVNFPLCQPFLDDYFNWTWTYKLNSDFRNGYITIYDLKGKRIGPKNNMSWLKKMRPITENFKNELRYKSDIAVGFISNCKSKNRRMLFVNKVQKALRKRRGQLVDIFGRCGRYKYGCRWTNSNCARMLKRDYFFYFSFENSFSEDYVSEKLMTALNNYIVPVVYGGADYNKFLPPGSYINARDLGPERLAEEMLKIASNESAYHDFFRWRNHYVYRETTYTDDVCKLCEMMNSKKMKQETVKRNFTKWWEGHCHRRKKCPHGAPISKRLKHP